jgi:hypothetical protein
MNAGILNRTAAALIAAVAWTGLTVQFALLYARNSSVALTLWILAAYFTILTNLLVAGVFTGVALGLRGFRAGWLLAGTMLSIVLVGVVNALLLRGELERSGGSFLVDMLLHDATPILVALYWIVFVPRGELHWRDPWLWSVYPLSYLAYALARGAAAGSYAYPFLDVRLIGWVHTAANAAVISFGFLGAAHAVVWIDRRIATRRESGS